MITGTADSNHTEGTDGCLSVVFVVCCVDRGQGDELITHSGESYRVCVCGSVCPLGILTVRFFYRGHPVV